MSEFIGSRISLVSRSDIRYVGTLHEINSETSTVALENVSSFGTEGRKGNPEEEIPASDNIYEYIVFRGSDVKDLRIEEAPAVKENKPPQVPNDPAILGTGSRPSQTQLPSQPPSQQPTARQTQEQRGPQSQSPPFQGGLAQGHVQGSAQGPSAGPPAGPSGGQQGGPPGPSQFSQHPPYPQHFYPQPPGQWGRGGPPPGPGYPGMPYGAPPGWYPPPGRPPYAPYGYGGFPPGPPGPPTGPPGGPPGIPIQADAQQQKPAPIGRGANKSQTDPAAPVAPVEKPADPKPASKTSTPAPTDVPSKAPVTAEASKLAAKETTPAEPVSFAAAAAKKAAPTGPKNGRIVPAIPLQSPGIMKAPLQTNPGNAHKAAAGSSTSAANSTAVEDATKAATAAVAAAMAKLPPLSGQQTNGGNTVDNLTRKVNEMRINDTIRAPRQPGTGGGFRGERGERGRGRGGRAQETRKIDVPTTDFDFESSNAKFNKEDLVKEAIAGSPLVETAPDGSTEDLSGESAAPAAASYNKKSSFFDDLSSDNKDRAEGSRPGGREWRGEEQKKNLETFGQGSVDNGGYRGGYRGRGRGRGGMRGRGYGGNGQPGVRPGPSRGGYRGGRGDFTTIAQ